MTDSHNDQNQHRFCLSRQFWFKGKSACGMLFTSCQSRKTSSSGEPASVHWISPFHQAFQSALYFLRSQNPSGIAAVRVGENFLILLKEDKQRRQNRSPAWKQHLAVFASNFRPSEEDNCHDDCVLMCRVTCSHSANLNLKSILNIQLVCVLLAFIYFSLFIQVRTCHVMT